MNNKKDLFTFLICLLFVFTLTSVVSAQSEESFEPFIHLQTSTGSLVDFAVSDSFLVLVLQTQNGYIIQAFKEPEGNLLWQKPFDQVYSNISRVAVVGEWLCLYGKEKPSDFERAYVLNLNSGKDEFSNFKSDFLHKMYPVVGHFENRLVLRRTSDFYILDVKGKKWFKDDLTNGKSFIAMVGERVIFMDKKNRQPLFLSLKDGSVGWTNRRFTDKEIDFLYNEPLYLNDSFTVKNFPVLLTSKKGLKSTPTRFFVLTETGPCKIYEPQDLMLTVERWKIVYQDTVGSGTNSVLVAAIRPDTPSIADRLILLAFDSNGNLLARREFEYADLHYIGLNQTNSLVLIYGDYQSGFLVKGFDVPSLNVFFEKDYGESLLAKGFSSQKGKDLYIWASCKMNEDDSALPSIVGLDTNNGQVTAFYPFSETLGFMHEGGSNSSSLFVPFEGESQQLTVLRIPFTNRGWWNATLKVAEPIYPNSTVRVDYSPMMAILSASAGVISQNNFWTAPDRPGKYTLTLSLGELKQDFTVTVSEYEFSLSLPELVYTNSTVEISYTPAVARLTVSGGSLEGNIWKTPREPIVCILTLTTGRDSRQFLVNVLPKDTDKDGVSDWDEYLQDTDIENPYTDSDSLSDSEDLSPTIDPSEPIFKDLQEPGMVRIEQPVIFYGLHGWVDVYTLDIPSFNLVFLRRTESDGVRHSKMDETSYKKNLDHVFDQEKFTVYDMKKSTIYQPSWSNKPDYNSEFQYFFLADKLHPNEYRFYYDFLQDFQIVYMKNTESMRYPDAFKFYRYIMYPVRLASGYRSKITVQFTDGSMYNELSYSDDSHYKIPGFLYSFFASNDFNDDNNLPYYQGIAVAFIEKAGVFRFVVDVPSDKAIRELSYLKVTPVWIEKDGNSVSYTPMTVRWDVTAIVRETIYLQDDVGNSQMAHEELSSFDALRSAPISIVNFASFSDVKTSSDWFGILQKDQNSRDITVVEMSQTVQTVVLEVLEMGKKLCSLTEASVKIVRKVDDLDKLPNGHWAKSDGFSGVKSAFEVTTGIVSIVTNGREAWLAFKQGDYVNVSYYALKSVSSAVAAAPEMVNLAKTTLGYSGKATKLGVIASKKGQVALAIATGVIEVGYDLYKYSSTDDPILKSAYGEKIAADTIDTVISVFSELYPPVKVVQITWAIEMQIYSWIFGKDLAYRVCQSPGSAIVFLWKYFVTDIPSQFAEEAYQNATNKLMELIKISNDAFKGQYIAVFVDPQL